MKDYGEEIRKQMLELWGKTVSQLEDISRTIMVTTGLEKLKFDNAKLIAEHDKLTKRLGEEVFKLLEAGSLKLPAPAQDIYGRIRHVIEKLLKKNDDINMETAAAMQTATKVKKAVKKTAKKAGKAKKTAKKTKKAAKKPKKAAKKTKKAGKTAKKAGQAKD